jgi:hypothetical protein
MFPRALVIAAILLSAGPVRADLVTPGSLSPAPTGWVTDQYKPLGLVFVPVFNSWGDGTWEKGIYNYGASWSPVYVSYPRAPDGTPIGPPEARVQGDSLTVRFFMPGTGELATTDSVRVHVSSHGAVFTLKGYDVAGSRVGSRDVTVSAGFDDWLTLDAPGMHSFEIRSRWPPPPPSPFPIPQMNSPPIYVEAIEFHPVIAVPEPGGLVLSGLGVLILTVARRQEQARRRKQGCLSPAPAAPAPPPPPAGR